jgi:hypothetical protein
MLARFLMERKTCAVGNIGQAIAQAFNIGTFVSDMRQTYPLTFQNQHNKYSSEEGMSAGITSALVPDRLPCLINLIAAAALPPACHSPRMIHHPEQYPRPPGLN